MEKYDWKVFVETEYFKDLESFFDELYNIWRANKNYKFIFISRRAFCVFLLMKKQGYLKDWEEIEIYSDRYIKKNLNMDFLEGTTVVLVDDSLITGKHMQNAVEMLQERTKIAQIISRVFVAEEHWEKENVQNIVNNTKWHRLYTYNKILEMSSIESLLFYYYEIPYMVELPVLFDSSSNNASLGVWFEKDEFKLLETSNETWSYYNCPQLGYMQSDMTSGVLVLKNHIFKTKFSELIQNMVVRLQILSEESKVKIVFIPFAILRSVKFDELYTFFELLYKNTSYLNAVEEYRKKCLEKNISFERMCYVAIYRAVVYSMSLYIGKELKKYLLAEFNKEVDFFVEYSKYNFDQSFIETIDVMKKEEIDEYVAKVLYQKQFASISTRSELEAYVKRYPLRKYSYKRLYDFMLEVINDLHHENASSKKNSNDIKSQFWGELITVEEYEQLFENSFYMNSFDMVDDCMSRCICSMLCQGVLVNELKYDADENIVYRGFSHGENSEAFYDISAKVFYAAVLKYYEIVKEEYAKKYAFFLINLYRFFREYSLFDSFITEDEFNFYAKYFRNAGEKNFQYQIENKRFLLNDRTIPYYIQLVENFINDLVF